MRKISILLADDHQLIREVWTTFLNADERFQVVGAAESGEEAVETARHLRPDVILMDINLRGMNGFDATAMVRKYLPGSKVIGVSMHSQPCYVKRMMKMGAMGFVTKNSSSEELVKAIVEVEKKHKYICDEVRQIISAKLLDEQTDQPNINWLSSREMEIIDHIKLGYSSREIGNILNLSAKTIDVHRYNILKKLKVKNTAALVNHINNVA